MVGTPKAELKRFERELLQREGWQKVRPDVEVKLVAHPDLQGREQFVLCRSESRKEKEKAMLARQEQRLWDQLVKVDRSLQRKVQNAQAVERRVGRWMGCYPAADHLYEVTVLNNPEGLACGLTIACAAGPGGVGQSSARSVFTADQLHGKRSGKVWDWYLQLQQAEAAFKRDRIIYQ